MELKPIRISKNLIQEPLKFEKELGLRFFKDCILKFNQIENLDKEIIFSFDELRKGYQLKNKDDFKEFMKFFHSEINGRKDLFTTDKGDLLSGGVFSSKIYIEENKIGVVINHYHKQHIYSKIEINKWHSVQGNSKKIKTLEVEKEEKEKLLGLMTTFISEEVKGKYSQRLLDLLMQFKGSGLFVMNYDKFKELLEIPTSYRASDIDNRILNKSKDELKKIGLIINDIEKIKVGREIKNIKIKFKFEEKEKKKNTKEPVLVEEQNEIKPFDKELGKLSTELIKSKKTNLLIHLGKLKTIRDIDEFRDLNEL